MNYKRKQKKSSNQPHLKKLIILKINNDWLVPKRKQLKCVNKLTVYTVINNSTLKNKRYHKNIYMI
jgi:hypothetical protein